MPPATIPPSGDAIRARGEGSVAVDLHIWRLDVDESERAALARHLSPDETERANRFVFQIDRERFIVGRGRMRALLGAYAGCTPGALGFDYGAQGKPRIAGPGPAPFFNLSHSTDLCVLAVCWEGEVGVDVERFRPVEKGLAERFFSPAEVAALSALPPSDRTLGFFRCWTRKEAFIKALGVGLTLELSAFDVSLAPDAPALLRLQSDATAPQRWTLVEHRPAPDALIAIAAMTEGRPIRLNILTAG